MTDTTHAIPPVVNISSTLTGKVKLGPQLFRREYEIHIIPQKGTPVILTSIGISKPLNISFDIQMKAQDVNIMSLKMYNLSDTTKTLLTSKWTTIVLRLGYRDGPMQTMYQGHIVGTPATTRLEGADYATTLLIKDGYTLHNVAVMGSVPENACPKDVLKDIMSKIHIATNKHITLGTDASTLDMPDRKTTGYSYVGTATQVLKDFLYQYHYDYTVIRNEVYISRRGSTEAKTGNVIVLDRDSGLLTSPQPKGQDAGTPLNNTKVPDTGYTFQTLLHPAVLPTRTLHVFDPVRVGADGNPLETFHQVQEVQLKGDYSGTPWYSYVTTVTKETI